LDPAGVNQGSVGLGLVDYIAVGSAMVQQLYDKKDAAQATLLGTVDNTFTQSQQIADQYQLAVQSSNTAQARVDRLLLDFRTGINFEMSALVNALQTKTQSDMNQIDAQYAYITLQAQMDYQTFSGPYAPLLAEKPDIDKTP
jgi:outer membrane protein TolC